jgi:alpha-tubulin suppressor-like RCC1 family protein
MPTLVFARKKLFLASSLALALALGGCNKEPASGGAAGKAGGGTEPPQGSATGAVKAEGGAERNLVVAVQNESSFVLLKTGVVRGWGSNAYGQLATGKINDDVATAVEVKGISGAEKLFVGGSNYNVTACVLDKAGLVKCWGEGGLIPGSSKEASEPLEIPALKGIKTMSLGGGFAAAVTKEGTVLTWGRNAFGALGIGEKENKEQKEPKPLATLKDVTDVRCGQNHACALHSTGKVSCWGNNFDGQANPATMGYGNDALAPKEVEGITDAIALGVSANISCVIVKDKSLKCWGANIRDKAPKSIPNSTGVVALSSGHGDNTCFIKEGGEAWCFGKNTFGEAGQDPATKKDLQAVPSKVEGLAGVVSISTAYTSEHTCAATKDGKVYCFGRNRFGALGDGTLVDSWQPKLVIGATDATPPPPKDGFDKVPAKGTATTIPEALPKGCQKPDKLTLKIEPEPRLTSFEPLFALGKMSERKGTDGSVGNSLELMLRNYTFDPTISLWDFDQSPRGLQIYMRFVFTVDKVKEVKKGEEKETVKSAQLVKAGEYEMGTVTTTPDRREVTGNAWIRRAQVWFGPGWGKSYKGIKLTYVGNDFVCGELSLENEKNSFKGTFVAPMGAKE